MHFAHCTRSANPFAQVLQCSGKNHLSFVKIKAKVFDCQVYKDAKSLLVACNVISTSLASALATSSFEKVHPHVT